MPKTPASRAVRLHHIKGFAAQGGCRRVIGVLLGDKDWDTDLDMTAKRHLG